MADSKKYLIDIKTGFTYAIALDAQGNCKAFQPFTTAIQRLDGTPVGAFGPLQSDSPRLPYGQTIYAMELSNSKEAKQIYTIVVPNENDFTVKSMRPTVTSLKLPDDLVKAGLAAAPKLLGPARLSEAEEDAVLRKSMQNIDNMIGLGSAKAEIRQNIAMSRFNRAKAELGLETKSISRHMVFFGNPGTGKTTFAREVGKVYNALGLLSKPDVIEVKREDLVGGHIGETALKTKAAITKAKGGVLFIDEAYALSRDAGTDSKDFGREAIDTLVAEMENMRDDLIVIVAGYTDPMKRFIDSNEGLKSRFTTYIDFQDYSVQELSDIMGFMLKERGYSIEQDARDHLMSMIEKEKSASKKDFGNARMVRNLVEKAEKEMALRLESQNVFRRDSGLDKEALKKALTTVTFADVKSLSLDGIGTKSDTSLSFEIAAKKPQVIALSNDNNEEPPLAAEVKAKNKNKFGPKG